MTLPDARGATAPVAAVARPVGLTQRTWPIIANSLRTFPYPERRTALDPTQIVKSRYVAPAMLCGRVTRDNSITVERECGLELADRRRRGRWPWPPRHRTWYWSGSIIGKAFGLWSSSPAAADLSARCSAAALNEAGHADLVIVDRFGSDDKWRNIAKRDFFEIVDDRGSAGLARPLRRRGRGGVSSRRQFLDHRDRRRPHHRHQPQRLDRAVALVRRCTASR